MCRHVAGLVRLAQIPFPGCPLLPLPESAESLTPPYAPATGLGQTVSSDKLNRIPPPKLCPGFPHIRDFQERQTCAATGEPPPFPLGNTNGWFWPMRHLHTLGH